MKHFLLTFLIALTASVSSNAQTLQIHPIYVGGTASFEVQNGAADALAIICYSLNGSGPYSLANGITLDLSVPIKSLPPFVLDSLGNGTLGPLPVPSPAVAGMQVWFQGVQRDALSNPIYTVTNMVPMIIENPPPLLGTVYIPGGTFRMGDHFGVGYSNERPVHNVTLNAFFMDKYEVSNTKFADYLNNSNVLVSNGWVHQIGGAGKLICQLQNGLNYNGTTIGIEAGKENRPVVSETWYGAVLYSNYCSTVSGLTPCYDETTFACDFTADGFRLPTEAEWEYASRGGEHTPYYKYPWGSNLINSSDANYSSNVGTTADVGSYAANGYGLYDMAGNVREWCNDWYGTNYYSNSPSTNPIGPASGSQRVFRGGSWGDGTFNLRCAYRYYDWPHDYLQWLGFRLIAVQ